MTGGHSEAAFETAIEAYLFRTIIVPSRVKVPIANRRFSDRKCSNLSPRLNEYRVAKGTVSSP